MFRKYLEKGTTFASKRRLKHQWIQPVGYDTNIKIYNCITKTKVPLIVRNKEKVSWYTCGPTVYDSAHIGHASCYVKLDIIQRILRQYFNLNVITVMNITDIDDKILKRSHESHITPSELARKFEKEFWTDLEDLNVAKPDIVVKVTDHIPIIVNFIEKLVDEGIAYVVGDGSVYFDLKKCEMNYGKLVPIGENLANNGVSQFDDGINKFNNDITKFNDYVNKFKIYGNTYNDVNKLSGGVNKLSDGVSKLSDGVSELSDSVSKLSDDVSKFSDGVSKFSDSVTKFSNINKLNDGVKKSNNDFALWKGAKPDDPYWETKWGRGRPGWHAECSALASAVFGDHLDIHAGGIDLRFPHHENEEAISCAHHQYDQWVNYWMHAGHLNLAGGSVKMSKSLGNCITIREMIDGAKTNANAFRMACAMSHYRAGMEFSDELLKTGEAQLNKFNSFLNECDSYVSRALPTADINIQELESKMNDAKHQIDAALKDDFNTSRVIKIVTELVGATNKMLRIPRSTEHLNDCATMATVSNFVRKQLQIFGFTPEVFGREQYSVNTSEVNNILDILIAFRHNIRNKGLETKDANLLKYCDEMRDELKMYGIQIKDRGKVSSWSK